MFSFIVDVIIEALPLLLVASLIYANFKSAGCSKKHQDAVNILESKIYSASYLASENRRDLRGFSHRIDECERRLAFLIAVENDDDDKEIETISKEVNQLNRQLQEFKQLVYDV